MNWVLNKHVHPAFISLYYIILSLTKLKNYYIVDMAGSRMKGMRNRKAKRQQMAKVPRNKDV